MNFVNFDASNPDALMNLSQYPALVAVPASFVQTILTDDATSRRLQSVQSVVASEDARVISDVYTPGRNRLNLVVQSHGGALLQTFRAKLCIGRKEAKNHRTLQVKLLEAPHMEGRKERSGWVIDSVGRRHKLRLRKFNKDLNEQFRHYIETTYRHTGIPTDIKWDIAGGTSIKQSLNFAEINKYTWCDKAYKVGLASARLAYELCSNPRHKLTLKQAVEGGLLPDYPVLEVPYSVFHKYDTAVKFDFLGTIQVGGASNYTKNTQTANRVSMMLGEPITPDQLVEQLQAVNALALSIKPGIRVYCIGVVHKVTREVK